MPQVSLFNSRVPFNLSSLGASLEDSWGNDPLICADSDDSYRADTGDYDYAPKRMTDLEIDALCADID
jgi:hypothetical protein